MLPFIFIRCFRLALALVLTIGIVSSSALARDTDHTNAAETGDHIKRPLFVLIFDQNCKDWCSKLAPIVATLKTDYEKDVEFAQIDVTQSVLKVAKQQAKELRIGNYIADTFELVPLVMIFDDNRKQFTEMVGVKEKQKYETEIKKMMPKGK